MRQITFSTSEHPTKAKALIHVQELVLRINGAEAFKEQNKPTVGLLIDRFIREERIEEILKQKPGEFINADGLSYSTAAGYRSKLKKHVRPKWGDTPLVDVGANEVLEWLKSLVLSPKTKGHLRNLMHLLFEKAMLWDLIELQRNPIELVKVKGISKRKKKPQIIAPEKFQELISVLQEPYKTMAVVAMCTGLRVSEVLALRWEHIDFEAGTMLVQQGVVHGRVGKVKTDVSEDEVPLDPSFADVLLRWKADRKEGLVFPSHVTGRCYHASIIQRKILAQGCRSRHSRFELARLQAHVSFASGRNGRSNWCAAKADATQQCRHNDERVRKCSLTSETRSKLKGCADAYGERKAAERG